MSVVEAWNGPGRRDGELTVVRPSDNGVHLPSRGKPFEHWYFDATFDNGYSVVVFFNKRRPEDMPWARPWVEITLYAPDGSRQQFSKRYSRSKATFTADRADVTIGDNRAHIESVSAPLPSYLVHAAVGGIELDLRFDSVMRPWMPGSGETHFTDTESFGWVVGAPRATVTGRVSLGDNVFDVLGKGYADHNWGTGDMKRVIDRWHWGRLYSADYSLLYATVMTQRRFDSHVISPLMLARDNEVFLSTGETNLIEGPPAFDEAAGRTYPTSVTLHVPGELELTLQVRNVIHAEDIVRGIPVVGSAPLRPLAHRLIGHPGYFRFYSDFELTVHTSDGAVTRWGTTLHELVALS